MIQRRHIPILDLKAQHRGIKHALEEAVLKVLSSGQYVLGPEVEAFEREFAFYLKSPFVVGVNSGTDALYLALKALGVGPGDEVITTPATFIATSEAIAANGAKPVFVDVRPEDSNINPDLIEEKITKKTKAILPVHLYGFVCDMEKIRKIADLYNLKVVEDCAQAAGAYSHQWRVGTLADAGCYSFYPTKNLSACGDAGAIAVKDDAVAERLRNLRTHGSTLRGYYDEMGVNSRLDELQAAILRVKLMYVDRWNQVRRKLAASYDELLTDVRGVEKLTPLQGTTPVYSLYCVLCDRREELQEKLAKKGIASMVHYPVPLHLLGAFKHLGHKEGDFPVAERISKRILAIPMYAELAFQDQEIIIEEIRSALQA